MSSCEKVPEHLFHPTSHPNILKFVGMCYLLRNVCDILAYVTVLTLVYSGIVHAPIPPRVFYWPVIPTACCGGAELACVGGADSFSQKQTPMARPQKTHRPSAVVD